MMVHLQDSDKTNTKMDYSIPSQIWLVTNCLDLVKKGNLKNINGVSTINSLPFHFSNTPS